MSGEPTPGRAASLSRALAGAPVRVGTLNPAKLRAVQTALAPFAADASELVIESAEVPSGVPDQPIGWEQIVRGARERARGALASGECALAVGLEDGLLSTTEATEASKADPAGFFNIGCAWVTDGEREGHGFSAGFAYPPGCLEPALRDQAPIGDLFDALWRRTRAGAAPPAEDGPSGRQGGNIGMLTAGRLDRSAYAAQAIVCALVRFLHPDLYD